MAQYERMVLIGQQMESGPLLKGTIFDRPGFAWVKIDLDPGQRVLADGGAMVWMDGNIPIDTQCGSCSTACYRTCAGESACQNIFTGPGSVSFSFKLPGDMLPFGVTPGLGWILTAGAFICGTDNVQVSSRFAGCFACCCAGEAPFLTQITVANGNGMFYAGGYGALTRHEIPEGKVLFLDHGLFFAANDQTVIEAGLPGGVISCLYGGEGLVMKFKGPAVVYSQNRDSAIWNKILKPRQKKKKGGAANAPTGGGVSVQVS